MYRMNCNLSDNIGARLCEYSERTGIAKVTIVSMALDQYLSEQVMKQKIIEQMSDPEKMAALFKAMGIENPKK